MKFEHVNKIQSMLREDSPYRGRDEHFRYLRSRRHLGPKVGRITLEKRRLDAVREGEEQVDIPPAQAAEEGQPTEEPIEVLRSEEEK